MERAIRPKFFAGFDWAGIEARTVVPPIRPAVADEFDSSNFRQRSDNAPLPPATPDWYPDL